ncbi:hypothetical protein ACFSBX_10435, partial [Halobellus rarus]
MRGTRLCAIVLACIMLTSVVALAIPASMLASAQPEQAGPPGMAGVPSENVGPPDHAQGNGPAVQSQQGPPEKALENIPTDAAAWSIHADKHAGDLAVEVGATEDGEVRLTLSDERNHAGREVAIDATTLDETIGTRPKTAYGLHESGDEWTSEIRYEDGFAIFEVPKFSSNTVEFSGGVSINATPATDGSTFEYELSDLDSASDPTVDLTGVTNTETNTISSTLTSGTINADISGTEDPPETTLTIEGNGFGTRTDSQTFSNVGD